MKLDSPPVSISSDSPTTSQLNLENETQATLQPVVSSDDKKRESVFVTFSTTFVTIFLAEIGDKTQLSTLLMSAESHAPWVVFLGSGAALITTSLLGVLLGSWIASKLSPKTVEKSAGVMLLLISIMLVWDIIGN
ncbi:MAG TPA: TMEM165/GDT1 family protein [Nostocaceae cyanobacterium]|nr:TMEM165/GDT1 family protein [Nostocaceae cyanobacterium]